MVFIFISLFFFLFFSYLSIMCLFYIIIYSCAANTYIIEMCRCVPKKNISLYFNLILNIITYNLLKNKKNTIHKKYDKGYATHGYCWIWCKYFTLISFYTKFFFALISFLTFFKSKSLFFSRGVRSFVVIKMVWSGTNIWISK